MTVQFGHESLAKTHDLTITLSFGVEIRTSLAAAHGKAGEAVFEDLFKAEKFENTLGYRGVKTKASFVRSN